MSYKNLEIWQMARSLSVDIHKMTMTLPKFEEYEVGRQIRRSSKTTRSTIVEGYGRRFYKADYIKFIIYSLSSNDETVDHLETLYETGSLRDQIVFDTLHKKAVVLGSKINNFLKSIKRSHTSPSYFRETLDEYRHHTMQEAQEPSAQNQESGIGRHSPGRDDKLAFIQNLRT